MLLVNINEFSFQIISTLCTVFQLRLYVNIYHFIGCYRLLLNSAITQMNSANSEEFS